MEISEHLLLEELTIKESRIRDLADKLNLDGICLFKYMNYAWFTGGGTNRVVTGSERGCSVLLILKDKKYVFAPRNEIARITAEQVNGQGFEAVTYEWFSNPVKAIQEVVGDAKIGSDVPIPGMECISDDIDRLRFSLTEAEVLKAKKVAQICSDETAALIVGVKPGTTEEQMVAELSSRILNHGVRPAVLLIGTDDRLFTCRHPVATDKPLEKYGLISLVGEKWGVHITLTRSFYIGTLPHELKEKQTKVNQVDAVMMANTIFGKESDLAFVAGKKEYTKLGYPDEWLLHHQGGAIGYASREFRAAERNEIVRENQMFGWNPTIQGTKSESTILVQKTGAPLILDSVPQWWPTQGVEINGNIYKRPVILER
ncbi:MAG: M24 family metallopeptidase [Peptococcales bacterium]|jgi:Xaa-Pro dipeptidase